MYSLCLPRISSNSTHVIVLEIYKTSCRVGGLSFGMRQIMVDWYDGVAISSRGRFCVRCMHELEQELLF